MAIAHALSVPLTHATDEVRGAYLRRVGLYTLVGLFIAFLSGGTSAGAILFVPALQNKWVAIGLIMASWFVSNNLARGMVFSESAASRWTGFVLGSAAQGFAMGWILLAAVFVGAATGSPLGLIGLAGMIVAMTAFGFVVYLWTAPAELSFVRGAITMMALPMFALMVVSFFWPITGTLGIIVSAVFCAMSAAGLLYQTNEVLHRFRSDMALEGAYTITLGLLVLFWNVLSLLMRLNRR